MSSLPSVDLSSLLSAIGSSSSGIDVNAAVAQAIAAESAPEQIWQQQQSTLQTQTTALNQINGLVSTLEDSLNTLQDPTGALASETATSSQSNIVTASAGAGAANGNHVVVVNNLASTGSWYSDSVANSSTPLAAGSFDLQVGSGPVTTITVGNGVNTLDDLASNINSQNLGVTASVVNDASGSRLALLSTSSGSAADFTISNVTGLGFTRAAQGKNASLTVDGIPISSASNTVTGAVTGLTFSLDSAAPNTEVNITVTNDSSQISQAISNFVTAYNAAINSVNSQFVYDQTSGTSGPLAGDSTVRNLQSTLLGITGYTAGSGDISTLGGIGISVNDDGTLSLDSATLNSAIQNDFSSVQSFLQGTASNGFASNLVNQLNTFSDPVSGAFTVDLQSISNENTDLQNQIDDFQVYIQGETTRLTAEYNQADITLQQLPLLQQQIAAELGQTTNGNKS
ncbi:MAG: flagellar filament capping protein FliD [Terriglobales bacterium]